MVELVRVVMRREPHRRARLMSLLDLLAVEIVAIDREQVLIAEDAAYRFGKGRGTPPAVLNFGDLFAYALARKLKAPLLFKGDDFAQTDVTPAVA